MIMNQFVHSLRAASPRAAVPSRKAPSTHFRTHTPSQHLDLSPVANFSFALNKSSSPSQLKNRPILPIHASSAIPVPNHLICRQLRNFPFVLPKTNQNNITLLSCPALSPPRRSRCSSDPASRLVTPNAKAFLSASLRGERRQQISVNSHASLTPYPTISITFISRTLTNLSFDVTKDHQSQDVTNLLSCDTSFPPSAPLSVLCGEKTRKSSSPLTLRLLLLPTNRSAKNSPPPPESVPVFSGAGQSTTVGTSEDKGGVRTAHRAAGPPHGRFRSG